MKGSAPLPLARAPTCEVGVAYRAFALELASTLYFSFSSGSSPRPIPAKLWRVAPPIFTAAIPGDEGPEPLVRDPLTVGRTFSLSQDRDAVRVQLSYIMRTGRGRGDVTCGGSDGDLLAASGETRHHS